MKHKFRKYQRQIKWLKMHEKNNDIIAAMNYIMNVSPFKENISSVVHVLPHKNSSVEGKNKRCLESMIQ